MPEIVFPSLLLELLERTSGASRRDLATRLGVDVSTVGRYVSGETRPSFDMLIGISDYFNVSLDYLVFKKTGTGGERRALLTDAGPVQQFIERELRHQREDQTRHHEAVQRLLALIAEHVDETARKMVENDVFGTVPGTVTEDESAALEASSVETWIVLAHDTSENVDPAVGLASVAATNLARGRPYRRITPSLADARKRLTTLQASVSTEEEKTKISESLATRVAARSWPVDVTFFHLDTNELQRVHPVLYQRILPFVHDGWTADFCSPSGRPWQHYLAEKVVFDAARAAYLQLWEDSHPA